MKNVKKEDGSFGDQGGVAFTSTNSGIFSPTYGKYKTPKKKLKGKTGVGRLADFLTENSPEQKMKKSNAKPLVDLINWVTLELRKESSSRFTQQNSGTSINDQPPRLDWEKKKEESPEDTNVEPSEFDASPDEQAALKQNDEVKRIKQLDGKPSESGNAPSDAGQASMATPAGLSMQIDTPADELDSEEEEEIEILEDTETEKEDF
tara:strand:+ start:203 stop:820 length:618 start_codon:yes stop_codon:yes gene_type:complete